MKGKSKCNMGLMKLLVLFLALVSTAFQSCCVVVGNQEFKRRKHEAPSPFPALIGSSAVYPVLGNVYPVGYYYVDIRIGYPPKPFYLDIDTGSDLTWLHCDAPCRQCPKGPHPLYRLIENSLVLCEDPSCATVRSLEDHICEKPTDHCDYEVEYADQGSSLGLLVKDVFPLRSANGSLIGPRLFIGCGFDQEGSTGTSSPTDGVLGLGRGKSSIVSQLQSMGLVKNVIGHCFSSHGGGFLFFGDDLVPSSGVVWAPMSRDPKNQNHYSPGPAELFFGKQSISVKDLHVVFDSGSSYTYFNSQAYNALISSIMKDLKKTPLKITADGTLSICWKGEKPFKSFTDVKKYFKPVILSFSNGKKAQRMEIPPESYLIISEYGNACSGILNGTEIGLEDLNLIGDNFFQDTMVIYDNEKQKIGWTTANCDRLPNIERDGEDLSQRGIAGLDILPEDYGHGTSNFVKEYEASQTSDELRK